MTSDGADARKFVRNAVFIFFSAFLVGVNGGAGLGVGVGVAVAVSVSISISHSPLIPVSISSKEERFNNEDGM